MLKGRKTKLRSARQSSVHVLCTRTVHCREMPEGEGKKEAWTSRNSQKKQALDLQTQEKKASLYLPPTLKIIVNIL